MASTECKKDKSASLKTMLDTFNPDNVTHQHLAYLALHVDNFIKTGEINDGVLQAEAMGLIRPTQPTKQMIMDNKEALKPLLDGATDPDSIYSEFSQLQGNMQASHEQQLRMMGALQAYADTGNHDGVQMGLSYLVKSGTMYGRGLQAMSLFYKTLPEYMLVDAIRKVEAHNELDKAMVDALGGLTPESLTKTAQEAKEEATQAIETDIEEAIDPFNAYLFTQLQHDVLDIAEAKGLQTNLPAKVKLLRIKQKKAREAQAQQLEAQLEKSENEKQSLEKKLNDVQRKLNKNATSDATELTTSLAEAQAQLDTAKQEIDTLKAKLELYSVNKQTDKELAQRLARTQEKLKKYIKDAKRLKEVDALQQAITALKAGLPDVEAENVNLQKELMDTKEKLIKAGEQLKQAQEQRWANKDTLKKKVQRLEAELEAKNKTLEATLEGLKGDSDIVKLTQDYEASLKRVQELEKEIASYDPREMLRQEIYSKNDAKTIAESIKNRIRRGEKEIAYKILSDMPQAKRDEVSKLLLC